MKKILSVLTVAATVFCGGSAEASSAYEEYLGGDIFTGEILYELEFSRLFDEGDRLPGDDTANTFVNIEPYLFLNFDDNWTIQNHWQLRPVENRLSTIDAAGRFDDDESILLLDRNEFHTDYGLILEELNLVYHNEDLRFLAGKFNPSFATAWSKKRYHGVFGTYKPEEYELREKLGFALTGVFEPFNIEFSLFTDDTTDFSDSALKSRGRDKSNGGAGNTESLESFSVTLGGDNFWGVENLHYNFGYRRLAVDLPQEEEEHGFTAAMEYLSETENNFKLIPFVELVHLENEDGIDGNDNTYLTTSFVVLNGGWNFVASNTFAFQDYSTGSDENEYDFQLSGGYTFENGLMVDTAYRKEKLGDNEADSFGVLLSYLYKF